MSFAAASDNHAPESVIAAMLAMLRVMAARFVTAFGDPAAMIARGALYGDARKRVLRWQDGGGAALVQLPSHQLPRAIFGGLQQLEKPGRRLAGYGGLVRDWNRPFERLSYTETEELQKRLGALGYYDGPIDGKIGSGSRAAIRAFQARSGMQQDGHPGKEVLRRLRGN